MKTLNELFDSKVKYKLSGNHGSFTIGDVKYRIDFDPAGPAEFDDWSVVFAAVNGKNLDAGITKTGNEIRVFTTVINIIEKFVKQNKTDTLIFTAKEPSRVALYRKMAKRFGKKHRYDVEEWKNGSEVEFSLSKK